MLCPQCASEYRTGFTRCSDCDVALVNQSPTVAATSVGSKQVSRAILTFFTHQFLATAAVALIAPLALAVSVEFPRPFGWIISSRKILAETPYFPVQIALALLFGWTLGGWLPDKSMMKVWILPFAALSVAFGLYPTHQPFVIERFRYLSTAPALSHFFGSGCSVRNYCFDQLLLTMPFYAASTYSLASWFRNKLAVSGTFDIPARNVNLKRTFPVSCLVWLCLELAVYRDFFTSNDVVAGIAAVVFVTAVGAGATTLFIMIGSGFVLRKKPSPAQKSTNNEM
jgi:hypothetical protein